AAPRGAGGSSAEVGQVAPAAPPLSAGQVNDNARFPEYLTYLRGYAGPPALPLDVTQRVFVRVTDGAGQPVAGAEVQLFDGQRAVFDGRTVSDGRVLFFPNAAGAQQAQQFRALARRGNAQATGMVSAAGGEATLALKDVADNKGPVGLDLVFLLDATGSMGDEIDRIKATVDTIATRIQQLPGSSAPRLGLVAFRDHGDEYVTRSWDFTADVQQFQANLANVQAGGGGDTPESVNAGLHDAIHLPGWADDTTGRRLRMIVLVGDAPPHLDYQNDEAYPALLNEAVAAGIKIYPIGASGLEDQGEYIFRQFAQVTQGQFIFLTYANGASGAPGVATDKHVSNYTVTDLDSIVVNLVSGEIANQTGQGAQGAAPVAVPVVPNSIAPAVPPAATGLAADVSRLVSDVLALGNGSVPLWLLLPALLAVQWAVRRRVTRARVAAPAPVAFTAPLRPSPFTEPAPWLPALARLHGTPTTALPAAYTAPPVAAAARELRREDVQREA
ncbi:MAG: VWA domain-containing protein, partial [Chloroflexota bacterium]|nr:VWA domain-containing protein [Chloroflexota bacterium]